MNKMQNNQRAMHMAVKNVFGKYAEHVGTLPVLEKLVSEFTSNNSEIDQVILVQEGKSTGITEQKQKEEMEMISQTVRTASAIYVYALDNSNFELAEKVSITPSYLEHLPQPSLQAKCTLVLNIAKEIIENLPDYGVTKKDVTTLEKEVNDYIELAAGPRTNIVTRAQATERLQELMKTQMDLLNQKIDKMMVMFKTTQPVFYNEYKSARIIVNMGVRHSAMKETEEMQDA